MKHKLGVKYLPNKPDECDWHDAIIIFHDKGYRVNDKCYLVLFNHITRGYDNYREGWHNLEYIKQYISTNEHKEELVKIKYQNNTYELDINKAKRMGLIK